MKKSSLLPLLVSVSTLAAQAQSPAEEVLVTGSYAAISSEQLSDVYTVLDHQALQDLSKNSLAEALRTVAGISVEETAAGGGLAAISIRGGESNFTQVLLDGVPVNDPTNTRGGGFDFNGLDPALVERIEIIRGPQSAVYGSDALAGVINIVSRKPGAEHRQQLRVASGQDSYRHYHAAASGRAGELGYVVEAARQEAAQSIAGSDRDTSSANIRLHWSPAQGHQVSGGFRLIDGERSAYPEQSGGPEYAASDALDNAEYQDKTWSLQWRGQLTDTWVSELRGSRFEHAERYASPGIAPFTEVPPNGADSDYQRDLLQWVNTLQFTPDMRLSLGADYRREDGESQGYLNFGGFLLPTDFDLERDTTGAFVEVHAAPAEGLVLQASARYDDAEGFDSETSVKLGASYQLAPAWQLFANWGEAFKLPSFFALGHALVGNPDLQPEFAESWDAGVRWRPSADLDVELAWFDNDYEDLVDFDPETFRNVNRASVTSQGAELQMRWSLSPTVTLNAQASYTDLEVPGSDRELLGRPEWRAGTVLRWQLAPAWHSSLDWQWSDEVLASSLHTGTTQVEALDAYSRVDWRLRWQGTGPFAVELAVDNLLDEDYDTAVGFAGPGRSVRLALSWQH